MSEFEAIDAFLLTETTLRYLYPSHATMTTVSGGQTVPARTFFAYQRRKLTRAYDLVVELLRIS